MTDIAPCQLVGIMASFYFAPYSYLILRYPASSIGMAVYWFRVSVYTYEELVILQYHLYDIPEDIVNEGKYLFCLESWWWCWGFLPEVRDGANDCANWC